MILEEYGKKSNIATFPSKNLYFSIYVSNACHAKLPKT